MRLSFAMLLSLTAFVFPARVAAAPLFGEAGEDFREGTWAWEVGGSYIHPIRFSESKFYHAHFAANYYFGDDVSAGGMIEGYYADQVFEDTGIVGAGLQLRWHFLEAEKFSLFVDGGIGFTIADDEVPEGGTHFNYTPRGGVGASFELDEGVHLLGAVRFWHISNGNLHGRDENPSQDGIQYYVGVMFTF